MKQYLDLLKDILENGESRDDRTETGVLSSFGHQLRFNLQDGFPAVTTKTLAWKGVVSELLWFLEGSDDERRLAEIRFQKSRNFFGNFCFFNLWILSTHAKNLFHFKSRINCPFSKQQKKQWLTSWLLNTYKTIIYYPCYVNVT